MSEIWKPAPGFESYYDVSSLGRVKRIAGGRGARAGLILKGAPGSDGYWTVNLFKKGRRIHQLICAAFHGPKPTPKHEVNHKDGCITNNASENLEWMTRQENNLHKCRVLKRGIRPGKRGAAHKRARTITLKSPQGKEIIIHGVNEFCRQHGLAIGNLYKVIRGDIKHHHGWRLP